MTNSLSFRSKSLFLSKLITIFFFTGLLVSFVDVFTLPYRKDEAEGSFTIISFIHYFPILLMTIAGLLALKIEGKNYPRYSKVSFILLLAIMIFMTLRDMPESLSAKILLSSKGLSTWFISSIIFVASNPKRMSLFKNYLFFFSIIYAGNLLFQSLSLGGSFSRVDSLNLLLQLAINLYWIVGFLFINKFDNAKKNVLINISFTIVCLGIVLTFTRSYIIHFLLVLGFVFLRQKKKDILNPKYFILFLLCILAFVLLLNTSLYDTLNYAADSITKRSGESTDVRKDQLNEFISQISFDDLLFGAGPNSTWKWSVRTEPYAYVDNQFFLLLWFGGATATILYLILFVIPGLKILLNKRIKEKSTAFMAFLWLLSMLGIAIYTTYSNNLYYYVFCVYAGCNILQLKNKTNKII